MKAGAILDWVNEEYEDGAPLHLPLCRPLRLLPCAPANMLRDMEMFMNDVLLPTHEPVSLSVVSTSKPD